MQLLFQDLFINLNDIASSFVKGFNLHRILRMLLSKTKKPINDYVPTMKEYEMLRADRPESDFYHFTHDMTAVARDINSSVKKVKTEKKSESLRRCPQNN